jgi:transglutaminase-like putative cysteine protease
MLTLRTIGGEYNGLKAKIGFIKRCYKRSLVEPELRALVEQVTGRGSRMEQVRRLFDWVRGHIDYLPDPVGVELTKSPSVLIKEVASRGRTSGDCDDQACLNYTLLQLMGISCKLRVVWLQGPMPGHIYVVADVQGVEVPFDTTRLEGFGNDTPYARKEDF